MASQDLQDPRPADRVRLDHDAQLLVEERGEDGLGIGVGAGEGLDIDADAHVSSEGHLGESDQEPAVGAVVVRDDELGLSKLA